MTTQDEGSEQSTLYQGTVSVRRDDVRALGELDIDHLPGTAQTDDTHTSFEALLRPGQVEALVAAGAQVTLKRTVEQTLPAERMIRQADPLERLSSLEPYREDRGQ